MTSLRDQIMDALLALLRERCGSTFAHYSRHFMTFEEMIGDQDNTRTPRVAQPALYLFDGVGLGGGLDKFEPKGRGSPGLVTLFRTIVIYATLPGGGTPRGPDPIFPGGQVFHPLIESIDDALATPDSTQQNTLTLRGLVSHVWLEGDGMMMTGELDETQGQGMQTLPVRIMMLPRSQ